MVQAAQKYTAEASPDQELIFKLVYSLNESSKTRRNYLTSIINLVNEVPTKKDTIEINNKTFETLLEKSGSPFPSEII